MLITLFIFNSFLQENSLTGGVLLGEWLRSLSSDQKPINTDIGFTPVTLYVIQLSGPGCSTCR